MTEFYAVIREDSKYHGQDDGMPFAISLVHSSDGYIWEGNGNRYRITDLVLLVPCAGPIEAAKPIPLVLEKQELSADELEVKYQADLVHTQWFSPILNQGFDAGFKYIHRNGKQASGAIRLLNA